MRLDDLIDVLQSDTPIPNAIGIHNNVWTMLALIEAPCLIGANFSMQPLFRQSLLEMFLQGSLLLRITTSTRMPRRPKVAANKYMFLKSSHLKLLLLNPVNRPCDNKTAPPVSPGGAFSWASLV
jgi:hypothetical protein